MKYRYIFWDWNGTLLDDVGAAMASVNDMLILRNKSPIDIDRYRECIGVPIRRFYEQVFDLDNEDYNRILEDYNRGYLHHLDNSSLTAGSIEVLDYFKNCGCSQIIVSSSNINQLKNNVKRFGIYDYFDAIIGAENFMAESKIEAAKNYISGKEEGKILVIGDLVHDREMADELGADCVLLTSGHENRERLSACGTPLIDKLTQIIEA